MKTELVRIGNSRGIRIPKPLIEQCGLGNNVELRVENDSLVISPERRPRQGWEEAFRTNACWRRWPRMSSIARNGSGEPTAAAG